MIIIHQLNRQKHQKMPTFAVFKRRQHLKLRLYCPQRGNQSCAALLKMWCIRNWLCLAFLRAWLYDNNDEKQHRLSAVSHVIAVLKRSLGTSSNGFWLVTKRDHYFLTLAENTFKNVSFNIASEASYFYILSGQNFIKNAKNGQNWGVFWKTEACVRQCYQTGQFL